MIVPSDWRHGLLFDKSGAARGNGVGVLLWLRVLFYHRPLIEPGPARKRAAAEIVNAVTAILDERGPLSVDDTLPLLSRRLPGVDRRHAREVMNSTPSLTERRPKRGRPRNAG